MTQDDKQFHRLVNRSPKAGGLLQNQSPEMKLDTKPCLSRLHSDPMGIFHNNELDFLEVQKLNNIVRAAYKEFIQMAMKAKAWVCHPPAVGSIEDLQEMFSTPPPPGSAVECTVQSDVFPITSLFLTTMMMDGVRYPLPGYESPQLLAIKLWASTFSNIICDASHEEDVLTPLKEFWRSESAKSAEVILVHAEFRLPAGYLPRWRTSFLRFKRRVDKSSDTWAIFDVSTDYFNDAIIDPTQRIVYKRRPSGVIYRQTGSGMSKIIWVENAVVQKINNPKNLCSTFNSNFPLTARHWLSMLFHNLLRNQSEVLMLEMFDESQDALNLLVTGVNLRRAFIQTVNPFLTERERDLFFDDEIRIFRDMEAHSNDYIASSTVHIPATPLKLISFLEKNNVELLWPSMEYQAQTKLAVALHTAEDDSNFLRLYAKTGKGVVQDHDCFLQEISMNEFCSFVLSTQMSEADARLTLSPWFSEGSLSLKPTGFAIMPAGPGGLLSKASFVTICMRQKLEGVEVAQVIQTMRSYMDDIIYKITTFKSSNTENEDSKQNP